MKKRVQKIRVAAIIIGCCVIISGIIFQCASFINSTKLIHPQGFPYVYPLSSLYGLASSFSSGTLLILLALLINPEKVVPLFDKRESYDEDTESE